MEVGKNPNSWGGGENGGASYRVRTQKNSNRLDWVK